jgi:hypothetical protein
VKKSLIVLPVFLFATQPVWAQQSLPITRVLLYKNGMAYIVRSGQLNAPLSLAIPRPGPPAGEFEGAARLSRLGESIANLSF